MDFREAYSYTCSLIGFAARNGDVLAIQSYLKNGAPVDAHDNRGWTPLHEAAFRNYHNCLTVLLDSSFCRENKSYINKVTFEEETAIVLAARKGHTESVKVLIEHGADLLNIAHDGLPYGAIRHGYTALWEAVSCRNLECVRLLLEAEYPETEVRSEIDTTQAQNLLDRQTYNGQTPLHVAADYGQCEMITLLLEYGARIDTYDDNHMSPIFVAAENGYYDCLKILINAAISRGQANLVNEPVSDKATPLYLAAQRGKTDCVKLLLDNGADPNLKAENPTSLPLHAAIQFHRHGCIDLLIPVTCRCAIEECNMSLLESCLSQMDLKSFQILIKHGVSIQCEKFIPPFTNPYNLIPDVTLAPLSYEGISLMGLCVALEDQNFTNPRDRCELTRCLLQAGLSAEPHVVPEVPPIVAAAFVGNCQCLEVLLKHGANVHVKHKDFLGDVALTCAAGLLPPSSCLLMLFLHGGSVDSCFGRRTNVCNLEFGVFPEGFKWSIQDLMLTFPGSNPWLHAFRLKFLMCLCWNPQLHPQLESVIQNTGHWKELTGLKAECSTLAHLCRRQIFKILALRNAYTPQSLRSYGLPDTLTDYLFSSAVGECYEKLANSMTKNLRTGTSLFLTGSLTHVSHGDNF